MMTAVINLPPGHETANRTLFGRTFANNPTLPDQFKIEHLVGGTLAGTFTIANDGDFLFQGGGNMGVGVAAPKAKLHSAGSTILGVAASAVANADLGDGQVKLSVDQTADTLTFKVKYSNGTVKTGTIALM